MAPLAPPPWLRLWLNLLWPLCCASLVHVSSAAYIELNVWKYGWGSVKLLFPLISNAFGSRRAKLACPLATTVLTVKLKSIKFHSHSYVNLSKKLIFVCRKSFEERRDVRERICWRHNGQIASSQTVPLSAELAGHFVGWVDLRSGRTVHWVCGFHYNQCIFFSVPVATPSPLPPPTERDSLYDEAVGGSTVIVHPSAAPTLSDDNSCCDVALPKRWEGHCRGHRWMFCVSCLLHVICWNSGWLDCSRFSHVIAFLKLWVVFLPR